VSDAHPNPAPRELLDPRPHLTRRWWRSLAYYSRSLGELAWGCRSRLALLRLLVGRGPETIRMADGSRFVARTFLDAWAVKESLLDRVYDQRWAGVGENWTVVDVGAGIGDFTVMAARRARRGWVHAYEPGDAAIALLRVNLERNALTNVTVHQRAVCARSGEAFLGVHRSEAVLSRVTAVHATGDPGAPIPGAVPADSLAAVLDALPGRRCDFLKMDCEGMEFEILLAAGAEELDRVDRISLEYHDFVGPASHRDLAAHLTRHGRSVVIAPSPVYRELGYLYSARPDAAAARG
jgi:FkbM family methyltransferase